MARGGAPLLRCPRQYEHLGKLLRKVPPQLGDLYDQRAAREFDDCAWVGYRLAEILPLSLTDKQQCLELTDPACATGAL